MELFIVEVFIDIKFNIFLIDDFCFEIFLIFNILKV